MIIRYASDFNVNMPFRRLKVTNDCIWSYFITRSNLNIL